MLGDALALDGVAVTPWVTAHAVALTWDDAVLCFSSAARFHGFPAPDDGTVHVIVPRRLPSRGGLVTHRLQLDSRDVVPAGRARVTSRQRTLFDCIGRLPVADAERLVAWAVTREVLSQDALDAALRDRPRWWGNRARRQAVDDIARGTLSAAERRLRRILCQTGITGWAFDQQLFDDRGLIGRADVLFRAERLVLEVDGYAYHARTQFQSDRTKQNRLVAAGFTVLRFTWSDLTERPHDVSRQISAMLLRLRAGSGTDRRA